MAKSNLSVIFLSLKSDILGKIFTHSTHLAGSCQATECHSPKLDPTTATEMELDAKLFGEKFGKDAALLKHLAKTEGACPFNQAVEGIIKLRQLPVAMDNALLDVKVHFIPHPRATIIPHSKRLRFPHIFGKLALSY